MSRFRLKQDKVRHPCQRYSFTEYMYTLDNVFKSVSFKDVPDKALRNILWDSYRMNLWDVALYAVEHGIDEIEHIKTITNELLSIPGCRLRGE